MFAQQLIQKGHKHAHVAKTVVIVENFYPAHDVNSGFRN